jgi:streptogramin lyase
MFICDYGNNAIRAVSLQTGLISTLAGSNTGVPGFADGLGLNSRFNGPTGLSIDLMGNIYVSEYFNNAVRMVTAAGVVSTIAGSTGAAGRSADGSIAYSALLNRPYGITMDASGNMYIANFGGNYISVIYSR